MQSAPNIDIDSLLRPISEDKPSGQEPKRDYSPASLYQKVKNARTEARSIEKNTVDGNSSSAAFEQWRDIESSVPQIFKTVGKDLDLCCWYIEALTRRYGFAGLSFGLKLYRALIETFWDSIYPLPEEEDEWDPEEGPYGMRTAGLRGLNGTSSEGTLIAPLRQVNFTDFEEPVCFNLWRYHQAVDIEKTQDEDEKQDKVNNLGFSLESVFEAAQQSSIENLIQRREGIKDSLSHLQSIEDFLNQKYENPFYPPSLKNIRSTLEECLRALEHISDGILPSEETNQAENNDLNVESENIVSPQAGKGKPKEIYIDKPIDSREGAFKKLDEIAEFLLTTDPHSPVSFMIKKALRWSKMSLAELLPELIDDESARKTFITLTGAEQRTDD